ncbi:diphosphate--fructose-6-phosphate 1-phosphotransferase [Candidatus Omnitrophus magneticus]|uniref:ATP-dependent 6-phosphofructokinase n=1 Tax=Candidatus Omnitrophus magneticus TaxID=1609969 RepID=A0A0F0CQT6_9BACT|nr:diphosphate--fructose-6-phosphate 1-phosphotransferase [Candidatus Omnitrophus magneticus]
MNTIPVDNLGKPAIQSPLALKKQKSFISDTASIIYHVHKEEIAKELDENGLTFFELAGPRETIYFNPKEITCGIVTCGGLCPGINDVLRAIVIELFERYGCNKVLGFHYGYKGLTSKSELEPLFLNPDNVDNIHTTGGTILSSSRGPQDPEEMVNTLIKRNIKILFVIGGDGTMRGAQVLVEHIKKRNLKISIIAIPKTIDNDLNYVEKSFGFETAVEEAMRVIDSAHVEAKGAPNGIGLVKLMGRFSGFIASHASLASSNVNFCLIPEVPFKLYGEDGFLACLENRVKNKSKRHAVIVVAEGAGQSIIEKTMDKETQDASGNIKFKNIGNFLKTEIEKFFSEKNVEANVKYIDPSYIIRSVPANAFDSAYSLVLAQSAVHAGMAGKTNILIGYWNHHYTHVPINMTIEKRKQINPNSRLWQTVMETTLQPESIFL